MAERKCIQSCSKNNTGFNNVFLEFVTEGVCIHLLMLLLILIRLGVSLCLVVNGHWLLKVRNSSCVNCKNQRRNLKKNSSSQRKGRQQSNHLQSVKCWKRILKMIFKGSGCFQFPDAVVDKREMTV